MFVPPSPRQTSRGLDGCPSRAEVVSDLSMVPPASVSVTRALGLTAVSVAGLLVSLALIDPSLRDASVLSATAPEVCVMSLDAPPVAPPACTFR